LRLLLTTLCLYSWGALKLLVELDGEAMPQIEEKLRSEAKPALRYVIDEKVDFCASIGMTSGALGTLVAAVSHAHQQPFSSQLAISRSELWEVLPCSLRASACLCVIYVDHFVLQNLFGKDEESVRKTPLFHSIFS
jgi:hypothetical protein